MRRFFGAVSKQTQETGSLWTAVFYNIERM